MSVDAGLGHSSGLFSKESISSTIRTRIQYCRPLFTSSYARIISSRCIGPIFALIQAGANAEIPPTNSVTVTPSRLIN